MNELEFYYSCIPCGKENAVSYLALCQTWGVSERKVRAILHDLSRLDNGDNYVLIRSSKSKGFYKTDNVAEIEAYKRECENRAKHIFATLKKARRVCRGV